MVLHEDLKRIAQGTLLEALGIEITEVEQGRVLGTMPVDNRTIQPFGILHGGASVAFAETLGSFGSYIFLKEQKKVAVGLDINANHLRAITEGVVHGEAVLIHAGRTTHIWEIEIKNEEDKLVCKSRLTMMVKDA